MMKNILRWRGSGISCKNIIFRSAFWEAVGLDHGRKQELVSLLGYSGGERNCSNCVGVVWRGDLDMCPL